MKNALFGYTYQQDVAYLFLALMDVEREIDKMTLEADVDHQFDDITLEIESDSYYLQIKDFDNIDVKTLVVTGDRINIQGKVHHLSTDINVIFFKQIDLVANAEILGFPAYESSGVYFVSLNRAAIGKQIKNLYRKDLHRKAVIEQFFDCQMDKRVLVFEKHHLPVISVYNTRLTERTVKVSRKLLEFKNILFIEGKPGIGKSHLVEVLQGHFKNNLLYRFWISNQDANHDERLKYSNFLADVSKNLFHDYRERKEDQLLAALKDGERMLIIDGLDHVENYNKKDLEYFINFIDRAQNYCKIIVLSRPLQTQNNWKKQVLTNWNEKQTQKVLKELYLIDDLTIAGKIYEITDGYPILVSYIAQQYKKDGVITSDQKFDSINSYYDDLLRDEKGKLTLAIFLCSRGFLMRTEFKLFLDEFHLAFVEEFIEEHPFLFEVRLNRISLFHDSLITYLRKSGINYHSLQEKVNRIVCESLLRGEKRFQSRFGHFDLSTDQLKTVTKWYASIKNFKAIMKGVVDIEAIRELYDQVRTRLSSLPLDELEVTEYYDLSLILNLVQRDHVSTIRDFQYTYIQTLLFNGYQDEDITSNGYLFGMLYYIKTNDASLLLNIMSNNRYDTDDFYRRLKDELRQEEDFFDFQKQPFDPGKIKKALQDTTSLEYRKHLVIILANLYLHETNRTRFPGLYNAVWQYMEGYESIGIQLLTDTMANRFVEYRQASYILGDVKKDLLSRGVEPLANDYLKLSLKAYLRKHGNVGSFKLWPEIHSYLRLSLYREKKIDLASIASFWTKYHQRKDYSLSAIDQTLTVFEQKNWISWVASVNLITKIQDVSEKGYRGLLAGYIMEHEPAFILTLLNKFSNEQLKISWFDLEPAYLDVLPERIYRSQMHQLLSYHSNRKIPADDIINLLPSNKLPLFQKDLKQYGYSVTVKEENEMIPMLKKCQITYEKYPRDKYETTEDPEKRFDQGILDSKNAGLIKKNKLSPGTVAAMSDGNYAALAQPDIFLQFAKSRIKREFKAILFYGLTGKSIFGDHHHSAWELPGSILKIMSSSGITIPKTMFNSFVEYLKLSLITIDFSEIHE